MPIENETNELVNYDEQSYIELQQINQNMQLISFILISFYIVLIFIMAGRFVKFLLGI